MVFEATPLWQRTLAARSRGDPHAAQRERLRASYLDLRSTATVLLNELSHSVPDYTVHDISHVDAMWETASLIAGDATPLNPAEAYVLGCGFVLHDAAMGLAAYRQDIATVLGEDAWKDLVSMVFVEQMDRWPTEADLDDLPADVLSACRSEAIRRTHADHAATLVDQPWPTSAKNEMFLIHDTQLREAYGPLIGDLAASHWWDVDALPRHFKHPTGSLPWQPVEWTIEPLKLACLLRLADATQIDARRAPTFLRALRQPKGVSDDHWRFQEHLSRPQLLDDHISYSCLRPFGPTDAPAWWLALDYLRSVNEELRRVDALLHDLRMPRLAARAITCVDTPERFAEVFPVRGWQPIDVDPHISDVRALIIALGGEQLYGRAPEVAVRELIQNAQDAVRAREAVDPNFTDGHVDVSLSQVDGDWWLEVRDNGLGMDEEIIAHGLLDFGRPGWRSAAVRSKFQGLTAGGFAPRGRFGVGFFSVFMVADDVTVTTRRFDGARTDARRLHFHGLEARPLLTEIPHTEHIPAGTTVRLKLNDDPVNSGGILQTVESDRIAELAQRLLPESSVPVVTREWNHAERDVLPPFSLNDASPDNVFDRLYPPRHAGGELGRTMRRELQADFAERATEITGQAGERLGLAVLGYDFSNWSDLYARGVVTASGFRADEYPFFAGYMAGIPNRASRDLVQIAASSDQLKQWIRSQVRQARDLGLFGVSQQLELGLLLHRALDGLPEDHHVAMTADGIVRAGDIKAWAGDRTQVIWCPDWPLRWNTRPARLYNFETGDEVALPDDWIVLCQYFWDPVLDIALEPKRDFRYEAARHHRGLTWEKRWWWLSGHLSGQLIRELCAAWSCDVGDILAPVAARDWGDHAKLGGGFTKPVPVMRLQRPG